jgi:hypothetical protein
MQEIVAIFLVTRGVQLLKIGALAVANHVTSPVTYSDRRKSSPEAILIPSRV